MRLHDYPEYYARVMSDRLFAECHLPEGKTSISYGEANARANRMARAMLATGLEHVIGLPICRGTALTSRNWLMRQGFSRKALDGLVSKAIKFRSFEAHIHLTQTSLLSTVPCSLGKV
jgi:acyl-CoA synthetase (AMP-forming)/AMP-acid ligase II